MIDVGTLTRSVRGNKDTPATGRANKPIASRFYHVHRWTGSFGQSRGWNAPYRFGTGQISPTRSKYAARSKPECR
jgi:hypothetical protein